MSSYISIDTLCEDCGARDSMTLPRSEATYEARWGCLDCLLSNSVKRVPSSPMVLKASYPDGHRSRHSQDLKEAARLDVEMASLPGDKRAGVAKEIAKLKSTKRDN